MSRESVMSAEAFERLGKQLVMITGGCTDDQLLDLADMLHDVIRHRREGFRRRGHAPWERLALGVRAV